MLAEVINISAHRRTAPAAALNAGPEFTPTVAHATTANDGSGETFTKYIHHTSGHVAWLTPQGMAERFNGHWFVARDGCRPMYVQNAEFRAALDANERRAS